jgi:hypothetical protein
MSRSPGVFCSVVGPPSGIKGAIARLVPEGFYSSQAPMFARCTNVMMVLDTKNPD